MIITWMDRVDLSRHISFQFGNVVRVNGRDYAVVTSDALGMTACLANEKGEPTNAATVKLPWRLIKELHIY